MIKNSKDKNSRRVEMTVSEEGATIGNNQGIMEEWINRFKEIFHTWAHLKETRLNNCKNPISQPQKLSNNKSVPYKNKSMASGLVRARAIQEDG